MDEVSCSDLLAWLQANGIDDYFVSGSLPVNYFDVAHSLSQCGATFVGAFEVEYASDIQDYIDARPLPLYNGSRSAQPIYDRISAAENQARLDARVTVRDASPGLASGLDFLGAIGGIGVAITSLGAAASAAVSGASSAFNALLARFHTPLTGTPVNPTWYLGSYTRAPGTYGALPDRLPPLRTARLYAGRLTTLGGREAALQRVLHRSGGHTPADESGRSVSHTRLALAALRDVATRSVPVERNPSRHADVIRAAQRGDYSGFFRGAINTSGFSRRALLVQRGVVDLYYKDSLVVRDRGIGQAPILNDRSVYRLNVPAAQRFLEQHSYTRAGRDTLQHALTQRGSTAGGTALMSVAPALSSVAPPRAAVSIVSEIRGGLRQAGANLAHALTEEGAPGPARVTVHEGAELVDTARMLRTPRGASTRSVHSVGGLPTLTRSVDAALSSFMSGGLMQSVGPTDIELRSRLQQFR